MIILYILSNSVANEDLYILKTLYSHVQTSYNIYTVLIEFQESKIGLQDRVHYIITLNVRTLLEPSDWILRLKTAPVADKTQIPRDPFCVKDIIFSMISCKMTIKYKI